MTTKYKIVLLAFPFDDFSATKVRPAVCLTDPIGPHRHVVFAFITSHVPMRPLPTDLVLESADLEFQTTGLLVSSTIQLHRLMTGATVLIQRELGSVPSKFQSAMDHRLRKLFDLK
jgi:mRNA interferase MazF